MSLEGTLTVYLRFLGSFAAGVVAFIACTAGVWAQTVLPPITVETTKKAKAASKKAGKGPAANQPASAPATNAANSAPESALKSPPDSFLANTSAAGTKTATPILETAQSVSVVTREQIEARDVKTIVEALQYVPGVYTNTGGRDPRFDQYTIRGFNAQGNGAFRDGLKELGSAANFGHFRTEPYGVERIDVIRGPSSVLYGQIAPGGLVNVITKRPTEETIREFQGKIGTNELFEGAFDLAGKVDPSGQVLFRLTGLVRDADAQLAHFSDFVPDDRMFIAPSFTWKPDSNTTFTVLADFQHDRTGNAFPVPVVTLGAGGIKDVTALPLYLGDPSFNKFEQDQFRVGYQFEHRFNDMFTVRQGLRYGEVDLDYRFLTFFNLLTPETVVLPGAKQQRKSRAIDEHTASFTVDNQLETKLTTGPVRHTILTGIDHQRFTLGSTTLGEDGEAAGVPSLQIDNPVYGQSVPSPTSPKESTQQKASQVGVYAQDQAKLGNWALTVGGRYDWANVDTNGFRFDGEKNVPIDTNVDDNAFTGRVGLAYLFPSGLAPYASYSTSFLPVIDADRFGVPFKPTTGQQYEAGIRFEPAGKKSRLTLALFDLSQQNVLTPDLTDPDGTHSVQTGEIRSRGFEAEWVANPMAGLQLIATYTKLDVDVTKSETKTEIGKTPIVTPEEMASIFADYTFQSGLLKGFGLGAGARYIGSSYKDPDNLVRNDAYTVIDAALHYTYGNATWALNVSNLFNVEETTCTTNGGCQFIAPQIVTATVRYRW